MLKDVGKKDLYNHHVQMAGYNFNVNKRIVDYIGKFSLAGIIYKTVYKTYQVRYNILNSVKSIFDYSISTVIPNLPRKSVEIGTILFWNICFLEGLKEYLNSLSDIKINMKMIEACTTYLSICYYYEISIMNYLEMFFPKVLISIISKANTFTQISSLILICLYLIKLSKIKNNSNDEFKALLLGFGTSISYCYMQMDSQYTIINMMRALSAGFLSTVVIGLQVFLGFKGDILFGQCHYDTIKDSFNNLALLAFITIPLIASPLIYLVM